MASRRDAQSAPWSTRACRVRILTRELVLIVALATLALWWFGGLAEEKATPNQDDRLATWQAHSLPADDLEFSPASGALTSSGYDGTVAFWNPRSGRTMGQMVGPAGRLGATPIGYSSDGAILATGRAEGGVELWDPVQGTSLGCVGKDEVARSLEISPDGMTLSVGTWSGKIRLWDLDRRVIQTTLDGHSGPVHAVRFAPDGSQLASGGNDARVLLWDLRPMSPTWESVEVAGGPVMALSFSADGSRLAWGAYESSSLGVKDLRDSRRFSVPSGSFRSVYALAFHPDGHRLFAAGIGSSVRAFSVETWAPIADFLLPSGWTKTLAISPDGFTLAAANSDGTIQVWSLDH